jgi:DNA-binding transcriptional MerR regulator
MQIKELAKRTHLSDKTIRYYELVGLLPPPRRQENGYREYNEVDVARVQFVAGARLLGFAIDDIREILALRDQQQAPCGFVLRLLQEKADEVKQHISELQRLEAELHHLHDLGQTFPTDDVEGKNCVCHLVSRRAADNRENIHV